MKSRSLLLLASAGMALAHPSADHQNHKRFHALKPRDDVVPNVVNVYVLDGKEISFQELQEGINNGTLVLDGHNPIPEPPTQSPPQAAPQRPANKDVAPAQDPSPSSSPDPSPSATPSQADPSPSPSPDPSPSPSPSQAASSPSPDSAAPVSASARSSSGSSSSSASSGSSSSSDDSSFSSGSSTGLGTAYDNSLSCGTFPSSFGAVPVDYLGLDGWTGIQTPGSGSSSAGLTNLATAQGGGCTEGAYCSYACPPGYEKSQWPSTQGSTGQSVGGLLCSNGMLTLTRPDVPQLCQPGASEVKVSVQNNLSGSVAVCRTDYPGTEMMSLPLALAGGASSELTCPDASTTYTWEGALTSAQYYVNPEGSTPEDSCIWGNPSQPYGNYAPLNLGVGYSNGMAWLSIIPNYPTTTAQLGFKVSIVGDDVNGECVYDNGQYTGGGSGCTVSVAPGGSATYVFDNA